MKKLLLVGITMLLVGCSSMSKNPKDYNWYAVYRDGSKLTAYVEWFDNKTQCVGSVLYVPEVKDVQNAPIKIVRTKDGVDKEFHMCSETMNPEYNIMPRFNQVH